MRLHRSKQAVSLWLAIVSSMLISVSAYANQGTTTMGTRGSLSQPNPPITSNANAQWKDYARDPEYPKVASLPLQFIDTREGGKLGVMVCVPADRDGNPVPARFPAILMQTAYRIDVGDMLGKILPIQNTLMVGGMDKFMIRRGYVSVTVDVRGTGLSSGETQLLGLDEQAAYADAVDWIGRQAWFDGNLGLAGTSYLGITALLTAAQQLPSVKAVFAQVPMGDTYRGTLAPGGMLNANFTRIWLVLTQNLSVANDRAIQKYPQFADQIEAATRDHIASIDSFYLPLINDAMNGEIGHATDDGDFWVVRSPVERAKQIRVPTFIVGASKDIFQRCEPLLYEQLKNNVKTKLLVLPGAHVEAVAGGAFHGRDNAVYEGAPGTETLLLQWFDQYVKGIDTGAESVPNVTQYVIGYGNVGKHYATTTDWPHPKASPHRFYLRGNMRLSDEAPASEEPSHDIYEPDAPRVTTSISDDGTKMFARVDYNDESECSFSIVQWSLGVYGLVPKPCYFNNAKVEEAQAALLYETRPLRSDLYINGPMQADIWMSATHAQAAVAVRIDDVDPSGKATPISTGIQSAAYRAVDRSRSRFVNGVMVQPWHPFTASSMQPLTPNKPVLVPVEIFPQAALIRSGHRLRVAITSSNQVMGIWPLPQQAEAEGNVSTIYNDPKYPSSLVVLDVPISELK